MTVCEDIIFSEAIISPTNITSCTVSVPHQVVWCLVHVGMSSCKRSTASITAQQRRRDCMDCILQSNEDMMHRG